MLLKIFIAILVVEYAASQSVNRCVPFFLDEKVSFNLVPIDSANSNKVYDVSLYPFMDASGNLIPTSRVVFRLCANVAPPVGCPAEFEKAQAFAYVFEGTTCRVLAGILSSQAKTVSKTNNEINGVVLTYTNGNLPEEMKKMVKYNMKIQVQCDKTITDNISWSAVGDKDMITLTTRAAAGCNFSMSDILDIFESNRYICFAAFIAIGLLFTFFGRHSYKWTLLLCGFLLGFLIVAGICYSLGMFVGAENGRKYTILGAAVLVGLLVGLLLFCLEKTTVSLVCGVLTVLIATALISLIFPTLEINKWIEIAILVVAGGIGGVLGSCYKDEMLIISSSLGGSFLVILSIGFLTKTLDTPAVLRAKAKNGENMVADV
jgi:hypothetical protein